MAEGIKTEDWLTTLDEYGTFLLSRPHEVLALKADLAL